MEKKYLKLLKFIYKNDTIMFYAVEDKYGASNFEIYREDISYLMEEGFVTTSFTFDENAFMRFTDEDLVPSYSISKGTAFTLTDLGYRYMLKYRKDKFLSLFILLILLLILIPLALSLSTTLS